MNSHTPGPWVLIRQDGKDSSAIATIEPKPETMVGDNYWTLANVNTRRDEWEANARLIAAAPQLLAACRLAACALALAAEQDESFIEEYEVVSAAIAKATGGAA